MPSTRQLRRRAPWALVPLAALTLAGCGLDGSNSDVQALVPTTTQAGVAGGADAEMAPEESFDELAAPTGSAAPAHLPQASLPPRDELPAALPDTVAVVGDSLTESAQEEITSYLNGLGIEDITIDGAKNRRMTNGQNPDPGIDIVERIAASASDEPELWVIALGTNDVGSEVSPEQYAASIDELLSAIPEGAPVVWVDVYIRDRESQVATANGVLRDTLAGRHDTIIADWFAHGDDPGIVADDGVHLTGDGRYMFAATIAAATVDLFE